ncbi:alpha/beta hydrolase, partial [Geodermatophilus sp. CPCC 206100]|uniref:alpha/beta hydrolase n=1 Tax=Geodermatophilus sp. CPCC 206100 TaxID=3020054 RepID=UPI003AFF79AD
VPGPVARDPGCAAALAARTGATVLGCDPRGRGLAVLALGDPFRAAHVAVLVPGSDVDLAGLTDPADPAGRPLSWARALAAAAGGDLAVVLWIGYATPEGLGLDAASGRLARAGAPALVRFVDGLPRDAAVTVVGHSYGAVVAALAAPDLAADDLVLLGSPGARAGSVADLGTPARVWAARAPGDWIAWVPGVRVGDLGHGADPAAPGFGARPLPVGGASGHDGYFRPGSAALAGLVDVATGRGPGGAVP